MTLEYWSLPGEASNYPPSNRLYDNEMRDLILRAFQKVTMSFILSDNHTDFLCHRTSSAMLKPAMNIRLLAVFLTMR